MEHATLKRYKVAKERRAAWDSLLTEAYRYALPTHNPVTQVTKGQNVHAEIFDATATRAVSERRAKLHGQLFPPFREWMDLVAGGPTDEPDDATEEWQDDAIDKFHSAVDQSNFHIEIGPALGDVLVSTGAIMVRPGTLSDPLVFEAIPVGELVVEEGADGILDTVFRAWKLTGRDFEERWPEAQLPEAEVQNIKKDPEYKVEVVEAFIGDGEGTRYELWHEDGGGKLMLRDTFDAAPLIAFRMDKAPGEWMGRGPVIHVLPDIKTANKVVELILKNASIACTGIWQAEDDGVLNPANIQLVPGSIIPKAVGSQGLTPLEAPGRFDVSQLVLENLQETIARAIMGPSLPPADETGRTAFEIDVRRQEQQAVDLPASLRLLSELVYRLAARIIAILTSPAMIGSDHYIAPLEGNGKQIKPRPVSPLTKLQDIADASQAHQAYLAMAQVMPELMDGVVDRAGYLRRFLEANGFKHNDFQTEEKRAEFEAMVRSKMAEMQAVERVKQQEAQAA